MNVIIEEGNCNHPCWTDYDTFILWAYLKRCHPTTTLCIGGAGWKHWRMAEYKAREGSAFAFKVYVCPLIMVSSFYYLGRNPDVGKNQLAGVHQKYLEGKTGMVMTIADPLAVRGGHADLGVVPLESGTYIAPFWVVKCGWRPPHMENTLGGLQHWVTRRITVQISWKGYESSWHYPPMAEVISESGLEKIENYIARRNKMVAQYITTWLIMSLFLKGVKSPG